MLRGQVSAPRPTGEPGVFPASRLVAELGPREDVVRLQRRSAWKRGQMPLPWQDGVPEGTLATSPGAEQQDSQGGARTSPV